MVTAIEANFNQHLDEARIKSMTGGEPITARFMRQNFFQFAPVLKLWLVANDRPRVRGTDKAFWRRVRVIPLTIEIALAERDPDLLTKLRAEWPGILAWAVRGCLKWRREGLVEPDVIRSATKGWQQEMDHLKKFVAEQLDIAPGLKIAASRLFDRYEKWCRQHGEQPLTVQDFKAKLQDSLTSPILAQRAGAGGGVSRSAIDQEIRRVNWRWTITSLAHISPRAEIASHPSSGPSQPWAWGWHGVAERNIKKCM